MSLLFIVLSMVFGILAYASKDLLRWLLIIFMFGFMALAITMSLVTPI